MLRHVGVWVWLFVASPFAEPKEEKKREEQAPQQEEKPAEPGKPQEKQQKTPEKQQELEDVRVVGETSTVERMDALRLRSPYPMVGVTRDQFAEQPKRARLGDVLDRMPGVYSADSRLGETMDTGLRGMRHTFVRMQFGNIQLPGHSEGRDFRLNTLASRLVGAIVILRNPPPEYDSDGMAGRIVVTPRRIPDKAYIEAEVGYGVAREHRTNQNSSYRELSFGLGARAGRGFGYNIFADFSHYPVASYSKSVVSNNSDGSLNQEVTAEEDKVWENVNFMGDFAFLYDGGKVNVRPLFGNLHDVIDNERITERPGQPTRKDVLDSDRPSRTMGIHLAHTHRFLGAASLEWDAAIHHFQAQTDQTTRTLNDPGTGFALASTSVRDRKQTHVLEQLGAKVAVPFKHQFPQEFKAGFQLNRRPWHSDNDTSTITPAGVVTDTTSTDDNFETFENYYALFAQNTVNVTPELTVLGGARFEFVDIDSRSFEDNHHESKTFDVNPHLSAVYHVTEQWNVRGSVAKLLNRPNWRDLAESERITATEIRLGNPDLVPSRVWSIDVGSEYAFGKSLLGLAVFYKEVEDLIELAETGEIRSGRTVLRFENVGDGWVRGFDLDQRLGLDSLLPGLWIWANQTFLDSEVVETRTRFKREFNFQPEFLAAAGFQYDFEATGTGMGLSAKYTDEFKTKSSPTDVTTTKAIWYLSAGLAQAVSRSAGLSLQVFNLLDAKIERTRVTPTTTTKSDDAVGRGFHVSFEVNF